MKTHPFLLLSALLPVAAVHSAATFLVENGQPRAEIVIAEQPQRTVRLAAADLQTYVQKISGARLPIVTEPTGQAVRLFVGRSPYTDKLGLTSEGLEYGAYRIVSGTDWMGFIGDDTDFVPREPWARNNGGIKSGRLQRDWETVAGGPWRAPNANMYKDFDKLPATLGLPDGKNHFCYSNPELFAETVRCVRAQFDVYDFEGVSVMPPDSYTSICQCPLCKGKDDPELRPRGSLSNHVWDFVNRVATEIGKTHPGKLIYCCAYGANLQPPTRIAKLESNVQVILVGGRRPKSGVSQQEALRVFRASWQPKTDRPIANFENYPLTSRGRYLPCFMARTIGRSINETKGVFRGEQIWMSPFKELNGNGFFNAFQYYFTARSYWGGPRQDVGALLDEYCRLLYGPAGDTMKAFFDYCEIHWQDMETDKARTDAALALFASAQAKVNPASLEARRLVLVDDFLGELRKKSKLLGERRGVVPKLRMVGEPKDIVIDGRLDETYWQRINAGSRGILREVETGRAPAFGATVMAGWSGHDLYFGIRCNELPGEKPNATTTKNGDPALWRGDAVEILLQTDAHSYYQIAVNPAGAVVDYDRGAKKAAWDSWDSKAEVATHIAGDHWTVEIRLPVTDDDNDPLHEVLGRKPSESLPWHVNVCRQRVRANGTERSALSPTGSAGFHEVMRFAHLHTGKSHQFEADPTVTNFLTAFKAASTRPRPEALKALVALADGAAGKLTDRQRSSVLKQAVTLALKSKDHSQAEELTARIPIEAERKIAVMLGLLAQRKAAQVIEQFGGEDLARWPFWAAGEGRFARGRAFAAVGQKAKAAADFKAALARTSDKQLRRTITKSLGAISDR